MRILYCKCFGIGNAVMAVPAIKALHSMGHQVDVLVGTLPDDGGAWEVMNHLRALGTVGTVYRDNALPARFDLAILAIPFDGRWRNGVHFNADRVMDGRTRPDPSTTGLVSWKKHETEYQMDNVRELGFEGEVPDCSFLLPEEWALRPRVYYIGVGYKKDPAGFWKQKHWGNENFAQLVKLILADHPMNIVRTSGNMADLQACIAPISRLVDDDKRFGFKICSLEESFNLISRCTFYVGNDTGMMHVATSCGCPTLGLFFLENSIAKSRPWGPNGQALDGVGRQVSPEEVLTRMKEMGG